MICGRFQIAHLSFRPKWRNPLRKGSLDLARDDRWFRGNYFFLFLDTSANWTKSWRDDIFLDVKLLFVDSEDELGAAVGADEDLVGHVRK